MKWFTLALALPLLAACLVVEKREWNPDGHARPDTADAPQPEADAPGPLVATAPVDGTYKKTIWVNDYQTGDLDPKDLLQLPNDSVLALQDTTLDWGFYLFDKAGKGEVGYPASKGYLAILKAGGQMIKKSAPIAEFYPSYGLVAFGDGFLTVGEVGGTNDTPIALFDKDLNLVNTAWNGEKTGSYRGLLVLGGN